MMVHFRSSFIAVTFVCIVTIGQLTMVHAAPQIGMRPRLRVLGVDATGSDISSLLSATATAHVDESTSSALPDPEVTASSVETPQPPDPSSSNDTGTELSAQANSAASSVSGVGVALLVGSLAALIQTF